jgi:hypothetical protein
MHELYALLAEIAALTAHVKAHAEALRAMRQH